MTAILTHVHPVTQEEQPLLPFAKLNGNYSDHAIITQLGQTLTDNINYMQGAGLMDLSKYNFVFVHEFRRWDGKVIEDDRGNDVSITMFGSTENLFIRKISSPDEGYNYSFEENGGLDGSVWGLTHYNGQPLIQPIQRGSGPSVLPHYLKQPFDTMLGFMKQDARM